MFIEKSWIRIQTLITAAALIATLLLLTSGLPVSADVTEGSLGNHRYYFSEYIRDSDADVATTGANSNDVEAHDSHPGLGNEPSRSR